MHADELLPAFVELEGGDSVFVGGLKIDHRWPQCDANGLNDEARNSLHGE